MKRRNLRLPVRLKKVVRKKYFTLKKWVISIKLREEKKEEIQRKETTLN